ncbi:MAG TPA: aminotransferase class III-fold pyridoxal phosphate-dependent enzyme, partial [Agromyces sp.]|nr:aminotransferase class III-fold pyridoxal phosphate-dependent enzyme [Agromyces sp.]
MTENLVEDLDALARELDRAHVFHSWSAQAQPPSLVVASGRGTRVWDHAGREFLDFSSQLVNVNIGHQHPSVVQAIREQAELLTTIAPSTVNLARGEAAKRIVGHA